MGPCGPRRGLRVQSGVSPEPWRLLSGGRTSPLCFFSSPSSLPSSQGVPVRPAGRAGLPVRTPQGHPQKFQAGETSPHLFPPKQPGQGSQRDPPSPPACLAGVKLSAGTRRPKAWTVLFDGLTSQAGGGLPPITPWQDPTPRPQTFPAPTHPSRGCSNSHLPAPLGPRSNSKVSECMKVDVF